MSRVRLILGLAILTAAGFGCRAISTRGTPQNPAVRQYEGDFGDEINAYSDSLIDRGRHIFRRETFGSEDFWGGQLRLHEAIGGERHYGVGPGLTARQALALGLKVDVDQLPKILAAAIQGGSVSLDNVTTTLELIKAGSVVGIKGFFDDPKDGMHLTSIGITCAICHSTVNDEFTKGIGDRLDGWPNRDLNVGEIVALAPNLKPFTDLLQIDNATLIRALKSWGPGKYDAELIHDGKAFRPDGKTAATLLPAAFGLAGVNLHTYTGWGSVTHWNAYVAITQMHGKGTFFDRRLNDAEQFPVAVRSGLWNKRDTPDLTTDKLAALHYYQLSMPAPKPPRDSYDRAAAERWRVVFEGKAGCVRCHVPPLFTEPGWPMHTAEEIGIDNFQASRSPDKRFYRTTPLRGLFVRMKGGFYHDGRFADLAAVVDHYDSHLRLGLTADEKTNLIEYLKSL
ncbi:MAG: hypothetical protein ACT4O1_11185 [Gemmatimonadota bacterium]